MLYKFNHSAERELTQIELHSVWGMLGIGPNFINGCFSSLKKKLIFLKAIMAAKHSIARGKANIVLPV